MNTRIKCLLCGEVAERLKAAVLKTVKGQSPFQGSNPCLSATTTYYTKGVSDGPEEYKGACG
jgi:hypothetical protein